ncbi:MAG: hypothetical protein AB2A00_29950 [Myxococcota bacterium]
MGLLHVRLLGTLLRILGRLLAVVAPLTTTLAGIALLCLGAHVAAEPVAVAARHILDVIDSLVDTALVGIINVWADLRGWSTQATDAVAERAIGLVDIPEKLIAVHALGLLVEGMVVLAFLPLSWRVEPWEWPNLRRVRGELASLQYWMRSLPRWVRVERSILMVLLLVGLLSAVQDSRAGAMAFISSSDLDLSRSWLFPGGTLAALTTLFFGATYALFPMLGASVSHSAAAPRWRRVLCLFTAPLLVGAGLVALW